MTTHSRIAAFLSTSALCLGLAAAPAAFAADATAKPGETKKRRRRKRKPAASADTPQNPPTDAAKTSAGYPE